MTRAPTKFFTQAKSDSFDGLSPSGPLDAVDIIDTEVALVDGLAVKAVNGLRLDDDPVRGGIVPYEVRRPAVESVLSPAMGDEESGPAALSTPLLVLKLPRDPLGSAENANVLEMGEVLTLCIL